jgi:hypothetical protein
MVNSLKKSDEAKALRVNLRRGKEMQRSKLIAKMAAVLYLSASVGAFCGADYYRKIAEDFFSNAGLTYLAGFITLIIGLLIVNYHNRWAKNWTVLITILGWLALLKGIFLIAFPQFVRTFPSKCLQISGRRSSPTLRFASDCCSLTSALSRPGLPTNHSNRPPAGDAARGM